MLVRVDRPEQHSFADGYINLYHPLWKTPQGFLISLNIYHLPYDPVNQILGGIVKNSSIKRFIHECSFQPYS